MRSSCPHSNTNITKLPLLKKKGFKKKWSPPFLFTPPFSSSSSHPSNPSPLHHTSHRHCFVVSRLCSVVARLCSVVAPPLFIVYVRFSFNFFVFFDSFQLFLFCSLIKGLFLSLWLKNPVGQELISFFFPFSMFIDYLMLKMLFNVLCIYWFFDD